MNKKTNSNIPLEVSYGPKEENNPGEFPFTNGIYPEMYRKRLWTMRQYSGFSSAKESNKRYKYLLSQGVMGLSVAFDLPTQTGYDSDHSLSSGEVGKVGVPICSIEDMEILLNQIPLDKVSISMTINSTASILLALLVVAAENKGIDKKLLKGTVQNDILKEYIARGTYIFPPKPSMRLITDIFEYCSNEMPNFNTISISGYHIREAGADAVQEVAFTLANGIEYVQAAIDRGLDPNIFGQQLSFFFNCHNHFFEEISKFRAARRMWAQIMKSRFKVTNKKALMCRFHTQTAGSTLTAQQIDNNIIRTTLQATSAVLGGTQSLHTNAKDEALALPTEKSAQLALRTQQVIGYETGISDVADPLAGSFYVEELTNQIEKRASKLIDNIDTLGGAVSAIENEYQQNEIVSSAYDYQKAIDNGEKTIVGVNQFKDSVQEESESILHLSEKSASDQIDRLNRFKNNRDKESAVKSLSALKDSLSKDENLMPHIINAVRNHATLGEISDVLRESFGVHS